MLSSLVLSCTYACPIQCRYCGAECGPTQKERLSLDDMLGIIDTVYSFGQLDLVVFTGGEPLLFQEDVRQAVVHCTAKRLATRIVTNAFWATSARRADEVVRSLVEAGLGEINISCDDYHQEFIPLERVKHANDACTAANLPCLIGHKVMKGHKITIEHLEQALGHALARFDPQKKNPANNVVSSGYTVPVQEDMHLIPDDEILYPPSPTCWQTPCSTILQRVIITPRKELSVCCGMIRRTVPEVVFGSLEDASLEELIVRAHRDLVVNWLALEGPYGIMRFIREKCPEIPFRSRYVNICHLCGEIFTRPECRAVLHAHAAEKVPELALERSLYDYMRTDERLREMVRARNADVPA